MRLDIQVNGGVGLLFNDVKNVDEFIKIELAHLVYGGNFIIPTFITDSPENMKRFFGIVAERMSLDEKEYLFNGRKIILPKLWGIHIEGGFITNKGSHPEKYLLDFNEENVDKIIEILKPIGGLPLYFTMAPELVLENAENGKKLVRKLRENFNITLAAGHTKITAENFLIVQKILGDDGFTLLTHLHNAMLGGHFKGDDGIPEYLMNNEFNGYFGFITDGHHTANGELLPTLLGYFDKICVVSDAASPACCDVNNNNNLFEMGGSVGVVEREEGKLSCFFWTDFSKNPDKRILENKLSKEELFGLYVKGEGGYKTLAGSAITQGEACEFLKTFNMDEELSKSMKNEMAKKLLKMAFEKNNISFENPDKGQIRKLIIENIEKMCFENPIRALKIDEEIKKYSIKNNGLYKDNELFIDFDEIRQFLKNYNNNYDKLRKRLLNFL